MTRTTAAFRLAAAGLSGGQAANCLRFDGTTNGYAIQVTTPIIPLGNVFTFGGWIKALWNSPVRGTAPRRTYACVNGNTGGFQLELESGGPQAANSISPFMNGSWPASSGDYIFNVWEWAHIVVTKNGTSVGQNPYGAFVNGLPVAMNKQNDNDFVDGAAAMILGGRGGTQNPLMLAKDFFAYGRVLSQQQIQGIVSSRTFPTGNRCFLFACSEGSGTTSADAFGVVGPVTLQSGATWSTDSPYQARTAAVARSVAVIRNVA